MERKRKYGTKTKLNGTKANGKKTKIKPNGTKANIETARKMKADGLAIESIIFYTGLSVEEVEAL